MSPTIQNISHRMRIASHQAAAFVLTLNKLTDDERAELRGFINFVAESADALNPEHQISQPERCTVVVPMLRAFLR